MSSSSAADWIGLLINFGNLVVNVLRLLGDEPVRRWFRQRAARLRGSGDTEMGQGSELDEVRRSISRIDQCLASRSHGCSRSASCHYPPHLHFRSRSASASSHCLY